MLEGQLAVYGYLTGNEKASVADVDRQIATLHAAGCDAVFADKMTVLSQKRPQLERLIARLTKRDVVVVTELSSISSSIFDLLELIKRITKPEATLRSLSERWLDLIGTSEVASFLDGLLEFDKKMNNVLKNELRAREVHGNRTLSDADRKTVIERRLAGQSLVAIARSFGVSRSTVRRLCSRPERWSKT